jgi:acyl-CoA-binding protein
MRIFSPDNDSIKQLYGLFKSLTVSPAPNVHRPSIFDLTGRAKWDAWSAAGKDHEHREDAERRYLQIARDLGWTDIIPFAPGKSSVLDSSGADVSYEGIWDSSKTESSRVGGGGGGMGTSVSAMVPPPFDEKDSKSLHGLAVANNASGLSSHLDAHPDADINELDEHVCLSLFIFTIFYLNILCRDTPLCI